MPGLTALAARPGPRSHRMPTLILLAALAAAGVALSTRTPAMRNYALAALIGTVVLEFVCRGPQ